MNGTIFKINERFEELERKDDRQEQCSWRSCILMHAVAENKEENTDQQAINFKIYCLKTLILKSAIMILIDSIRLDVITREKSKTCYSKICYAQCKCFALHTKRKFECKWDNILEILITKRTDKLNGLRVKCFFICVNIIFFYSFFSEEFHSDVRLFCSFSISGIAL